MCLASNWLICSGLTPPKSKHTQISAISCTSCADTLPESDRYLHVTRTDVQWLVDSPYWLDVAAFEAALEEAKEHPHVRQDAIRRAEALYRGELLPHLYDDWVLTAREEYHQRFMDGAGNIVEELEVAQETAAAITFAQRLLNLDPLARRNLSYVDAPVQREWRRAQCFADISCLRYDIESGIRGGSKPDHSSSLSIVYSMLSPHRRHLHLQTQLSR